MTTSGTSAWNIDILDIIEEAYERAGLESRTGYDYRTARRSLNMINAEWSNRGLNLWTIDTQTINLVAGQSTYTLPADNIDMLDTVIRLTQQGSNLDFPLSRIGVSDYAAILANPLQGAPCSSMCSAKSVRALSCGPCQIKPIH